MAGMRGCVPPVKIVKMVWACGWDEGVCTPSEKGENGENSENCENGTGCWGEGCVSLLTMVKMARSAGVWAVNL